MNRVELLNAPKLVDALEAKFLSHTATVGIIGMGYVGLPLARAFALKGFKVIGLDIDTGKVAKLNAGQSYIKHIAAASYADLVKAKQLVATTDFGRLAECDAIAICVPTPLTAHREPDVSFIEATARSVRDHVRPGQLIILESSTYPGTTDEVMRPIVEESGLKAGRDFFLAFSPEREDPGNPHYETSTTPKVVGGDGEAALRLACALYDQIVPHTVCRSRVLRTAEAMKLTENIFRAVNIALVNELKVLFERMGIDVWEVIEAAKSKPFGFMPFYPGPGLGGHCIPIDPFYLTWKAREYRIRHALHRTGRRNQHGDARIRCRAAGDRAESALPQGGERRPNSGSRPLLQEERRRHARKSCFPSD